MIFFRFLFITFFCFSLLFSAQNQDDLYKRASEFEKQGKYKEAMLLYKQLAKKEKKINNTYIDEDKQKENEAVT
jgi:phospholipase A1/A2